MHNYNVCPVILTILDGWGQSTEREGNAIHLAHTPTMDKLFRKYPTTYLAASGREVGLPIGQVGNSEVGHTSIGGGRIIPQDLVKIGAAIHDSSFYDSQILKQICKDIKESKSKIHLIGLCSDGGVHSHIDHLIALLKLLKQQEIQNVCIHFITDGRDTQPKCAEDYINNIDKHIQTLNLGKICTISGRYYAMDRDCRWSRTEAYYNILTNDTPCEKQEPLQLINQFYDKNISDEFIIPTRISAGAIQDKDGVIFFNFRPDRMRQLVQAFSKKTFKAFRTKQLNNLKYVTFTQYDSTFKIPIVFQPPVKKNFLGEIISQNNLKQLRLAETEKYAHVTYFFNGGVEEPFPGEDRELISSPQVNTYDETPDMSAEQITNSLIKAMHKKQYSLIVVNYANPDMIGHTGNLNATIQAIETVDKCLSKVLIAAEKVSSTVIITADHGNAECMVDPKGLPCKSHTTNLVPLILVNKQSSFSLENYIKLKNDKHSSLADIAPTILNLLNIKPPNDMTGQSLIVKINPNSLSN
uniref:2,3-bisphosphoglycerate-independent phosphoglycerate mutase n=1 Tax=Acrochaetium secundatum TaxID=209631 RepID=A0A4D6BKX1_9FLOR|nr:Phosphoglycerate mutase [Acrochaetium secundatum]QBX88511.1 Phosphoglycerate mutase [Acrochaetium secundatum]